MKLTDIKTTTYAYGEYLIDIVDRDNSYEAWINKDGNSDRTFMFGVFKGNTTEPEFVEMVEANLDVYIPMNQIEEAVRELNFCDDETMHNAIKELYSALNLNVESAVDDVNNYYLTVNLGSDGNEYLWYMDENKNGAIRLVDGSEVITDEDTISKLFEE